MATIGQYYYNVTDVSTGEKISTSGFNPQEGKTATYYTKLSIQAPAGTEITLTDKNGVSVTVIVGRSGYYEVPEEIYINKFSMKPGTVYALSADISTEDAVALKEKIESEVSALNNLVTIVENGATIDTQYSNKNYEDLYSDYTSLLNTKVVDITPSDLENIIIDYIIDNGGEN